MRGMSRPTRPEPPVPSDPGIAWLGVAWVGAVILAWVGWVPLSLLDQVVLLGIAVVLPLSIGGRLWWWAAAAGGALLSFLVPTGWAGLLVTPFFVAAVWTAWMYASAAGPLRAWRIVETAEVTASAYAAVAASALAQSRFGVGLFDIYEPIVQLTAVHFTFAGSAALVLAIATLADADAAWERVAVVAVSLTATAPPIVALGFVTASSIAQVGGAVLMTVGVWLTAVLQLRSVLTGRCDRAASVLLAVSGLSIWVPMVLAVAWASAHYWNVPALSIPDMARTHGLANAFGFVLCGLLARRLECTRVRAQAVMA